MDMYVNKLYCDIALGGLKAAGCENAIMVIILLQ